MNKGILKRLDDEAVEKNRSLTDKYNEKGVLDANELFGSRGISKALGDSRILFRGFNAQRILTSVPLYGAVVTTICPFCSCVDKPNSARPLFESGAIVPVLVAPYQSYPQGFVSELLKFPHINAYEFDLFRHASLVAQADTVVCQHCVDRKKDKVLGPFRGSFELTEMLNDFFYALKPYVNADYELIEEMESAVADKDAPRIAQLFDLADTINSVRTSQAFGATTNVPLEQLRSLPPGTAQEQLIQPLSSNEVKQFVAQELGLILPKDIPPDRYLEIVLPHRQRLSKLIAGIVDRPGTNSLQPVVDAIETINDEIRSAQKKTRFLAYRAAVGVAAGNRALIASILVGGTLAAAGHLGLCTASAAVGVGLKALAKMGKLKGQKTVKDAERAVVRDLQPQVAKILAKYLGITTRAVEVWQLREQLIGGAKGSSAAVRTAKKKT